MTLYAVNPFRAIVHGATTTLCSFSDNAGLSSTCLRNLRPGETMLPSLTLLLLRRDDFLALELQFVNLRLEGTPRAWCGSTRPKPPSSSSGFPPST